MSARPALVTLPATHPYVDAVVPRGVAHVGTRPTDGPEWGTDPLWDPQRWATVAAGVDVVHVHFGFDAVAPDVLREWVAVTRAHGVRLVLTVHDLRNPWHEDPSTLQAQLAVLVPAADALLTLTPGAAAEVHASFGRTPEVVPHPAIFEGPAPVAREAGLVGIHLKSFRTNLGDVVPGVTATAEAVAAAGGRLQIGVHTEVEHDPRTRAVRAAVAGHPAATVVVHDRFDDDRLRLSLSRLSVSVQLHRWGTHSGWVEACHDVGTAVVSPVVGYAHEQWDEIFPYRVDDPASLRRAVTAALESPAPTPAAPVWRREQLDHIRAVHARAYAS